MNALAILFKSKKSLADDLAEARRENASLKETLAVMSNPEHRQALNEYADGNFDGVEMTVDEFIDG